MTTSMQTLLTQYSNLCSSKVDLHIELSAGSYTLTISNDQSDDDYMRIDIADTKYTLMCIASDESAGTALSADHYLSSLYDSSLSEEANLIAARDLNELCVLAANAIAISVASNDARKAAFTALFTLPE